MTGPEATLLQVIASIRTNPARANMLLADLLGVHEAAGIGVTAHALANAFADLALPLEDNGV